MSAHSWTRQSLWSEHDLERERRERRQATTAMIAFALFWLVLSLASYMYGQRCFHAARHGPPTPPASGLPSEQLDPPELDLMRTRCTPAPSTCMRCTD